MTLMDAVGGASTEYTLGKVRTHRFGGSKSQGSLFSSDSRPTIPRLARARDTDLLVYRVGCAVNLSLLGRLCLGPLKEAAVNACTYLRI